MLTHGCCSHLPWGDSSLRQGAPESCLDMSPSPGPHWGWVCPGLCVSCQVKSDTSRELVLPILGAWQPAGNQDPGNYKQPAVGRKWRVQSEVQRDVHPSSTAVTAQNPRLQLEAMGSEQGRCCHLLAPAQSEPAMAVFSWIWNLKSWILKSLI